MFQPSFSPVLWCKVVTQTSQGRPAVELTRFFVPHGTGKRTRWIEKKHRKDKENTWNILKHGSSMLNIECSCSCSCSCCCCCCCCFLLSVSLQALHLASCCPNVSDRLFMNVIDIDSVDVLNVVSWAWNQGCFRTVKAWEQRPIFLRLVLLVFYQLENRSDIFDCSCKVQSVSYRVATVDDISGRYFLFWRSWNPHACCKIFDFCSRLWMTHDWIYHEHCVLWCWSYNIII